MSNLTPRILDLVARLSRKQAHGPAAPGLEASTTPLDRAALESAYRQALRRWFDLTAQGPAADRTQVARVYQEILRLIDDVGEPQATALRRQRARQWWQETGLCPFCGERGPYHEPDRGGEPNDA